MRVVIDVHPVVVVGVPVEPPVLVRERTQSVQLHVRESTCQNKYGRSGCKCTPVQPA